MRHDVIENLYDIVDEMSMLLVEHASLRYLEALCAASANIMAADVLQEVDLEIEIKLFSLAKQLNETEFDANEVRKALQLALLKGMKADYVSLDQMTPDGVALIVGHLVSKLVPSLGQRSLADFTSGTGNLLTAVLNTAGEIPAAIYGVDEDYQMLELSKMMADMQDYNIQFFHQSSARAMACPLVDVIIGDLPMEGHVEAADINSKLAAEGCNYLPYLLVENHLNYLTDGGYGIYLIANNFFSQASAAKFHEVLTSSATIAMLLQLPEALFKDSSKQKSILVIRKDGKGFTKVQEALVANFPDFGNIEGFRTMLTKIEKWITINNV